MCSLPPSAQQHRAGCYFRHTQGLTWRSRDLPAPKVGLAGFHRHRCKCMSTTYRHTRTQPHSNTHRCAHTYPLKEPLPTYAHSHRHKGTQTQEEESELPLAKHLHFSKHFSIRDQRLCPHTLPHPIFYHSPSQSCIGTPIGPRTRLPRMRRAKLD